MGRQIRCKKCRERFTPPIGTNRIHCFACRPSRAGLTLAPPPGGRPEESGDVERAARGELGRSARTGSVAGVVAIRLARVLDSATLTGSQASALSAQLLKTMAVATAGGPVEPDEIDEFTRRAREKRDSAGVDRC